MSYFLSFSEQTGLNEGSRSVAHFQFPVTTHLQHPTDTHRWVIYVC